MKAWRYFKDRAGDFLLVSRKPLRGDIYDAAAPDKRGNPRTVERTVVNDRYLARCVEVPKDDVPPVWRDALTEAV